MAGDFLAWFDGPAFADNPDWGGCYCRCFKAAGRAAWEAADPAANRAAAAADIAAGRQNGYLAYVDGRVRAWLAADAKAAYPMLKDFPGLVDPADAVDRPDPADRDAGAAIVCLLAEAPWRRRGLGRALLAAALEDLAARGYPWVEAYPRDTPVGLALSDAEAYPGPAGLYAAAGFARLRTAGDRQVWRRPLP